MTATVPQTNNRPNYDRTTTVPYYGRPNPTTVAPAPAPAPAAPVPAVPTRGAYDAGIDQVRYWVGAGITAVLAALVGIVGLIIAHGIIHVPVMFGSGTALSPLNATLYGLAAAGVALGAAGLFDGMLHVAPRPALYYCWLIALVTALAALLPFTTTAALSSQIVLAAMNLGVGLITMVLVPMAAVNARR